MLVLNTGQVPWELARQLETVYSQFLNRISDELGPTKIEIFLKDDQRRRTSAAQYKGSAIVELLLLFSSRKADIEVRDKVAEDFARLNAIEATGNDEFISYFLQMLNFLAKLDQAFSKLGRQDSNPFTRLSAGKDIFGSFPAMAGFAVAVAIHLFDEPGFAIDWANTKPKMAEVAKAVSIIVEKIDALASQDEIRAFLALDLLEERMSGRRGGVGRYERELFRKAFASMLANAGRLENLEPCWLAA